MQGRNGEAEDLYRRSLAVKADQPQVHHNLGNLLIALFRTDEAIAEQQEAIRLKPNYVEAHLNLGLALSKKGDPAAAEKSFRNALRIQPNFVFAKQSLGAVLNDLGRSKEAEAILRQALAAGSHSPRQIAALEHNLGVSAMLQQHHGEALKLFESAQTKVPDMPLADYSRGNALQWLGRSEDAVACFQRAIARNPLDFLAHNELNRVLYRLADDEQFLRSYDQAMALYPEIAELPVAKGGFLFQKGEYGKAREEFERAVRLLPDSVKAHDMLGTINARLSDFGTAIREHETAVGIEPENPHAWRNFAETLLRAGDAEKGLAAAERSLALEPEHQGTLAMWGIALRALDDPRGETLNDYENFVQQFEIEPPQGFGDIESFNGELNHYLDRLHRDKREVIDQTLRGGTQTFGNLFGQGHGLVESLRVRIDEAVAAYIGRMKEDANHPLLKRRHPQFAYSGSWSSRLQDCGYHTNHFHMKGWISSAYYVALPEAVGDVQGRQGWLKFGEPAFDAGFKDPIRRVVQPKVGALVLFPSYMWHGTVPFQSERARTTIAFDVVPK
jgi:tetratricopeptide (TPR) repeat protein